MEIQVIIVAIQVKPVEIQVNVVQLHLSSEEIHCSKYSIEAFEKVSQVSVGWKAPDLHISKMVATKKGRNHNFCTKEQERVTLNIFLWFSNIPRYAFHTNPKHIYLRTLIYVNPLFNLCVLQAGIITSVVPILTSLP